MSPMKTQSLQDAVAWEKRYSFSVSSQSEHIYTYMHIQINIQTCLLILLLARWLQFVAGIICMSPGVAHPHAFNVVAIRNSPAILYAGVLFRAFLQWVVSFDWRNQFICTRLGRPQHKNDFPGESQQVTT